MTDRVRRWPSRNPPDKAVFRSLVVGGVIPTLAAVAIRIAYGDTPISQQGAGYLGTLQWTLLCIASLLALVYLSTLFDWYYTLPRISGLVWNLHPCNSASDRRWLTVTRNWLLHRWITETAGSILLALALWSLLSLISPPLSFAVSIVSSAIILVVQGFRAHGRLDRVVDPHQNPVIGVGRLVHVRQRDQPEKPSIYLPGTQTAQRPLFYIVDTSIQGYKVKQVQGAALYGGEAFGPNKEDGREYQLDELEPTNQSFHGCDLRCSGINWYCDNNVRSDRYT